MRALTARAVLRCDHDGVVANRPGQSLVTVGGVPLLVEDDPVGRAVHGCPNIGPSIKPCRTTLAVREGYSGFVTVQGRAVCLEPVRGFTDGTPPGVVTYTVRDPGQSLVEAGS